MSRLKVRPRPLFPVLSLGLLLLASGCASRPDSSPVTAQESAASVAGEVRATRLAVAGISRPGNAGALEAKYDASIFDSAIYRVPRRDDTLRFWSEPALMGSFISCFDCAACWACEKERCPTCDPAAGPCPAGCNDGCPCQTCSSKCIPVTGTRAAPSDIWVSFADEFHEVCSQFPADDLILRIQQLQGLPPNLDQPDDSWQILTVRVDRPDQLFRPCNNPNPKTPGPCTAEFPDGVSVGFRSWIAGQAMSSWQIPDGYPWTRQGYTYNWHGTPGDSSSIVGTSEFVIPEGTDVEMLGLVTAREFCLGPAPNL